LPVKARRSNSCRGVRSSVIVSHFLVLCILGNSLCAGHLYRCSLYSNHPELSYRQETKRLVRIWLCCFCTRCALRHRRHKRCGARKALSQSFAYPLQCRNGSSFTSLFRIYP
jgi:hypothetical protein